MTDLFSLWKSEEPHHSFTSTSTRLDVYVHTSNKIQQWCCAKHVLKWFCNIYQVMCFVHCENHISLIDLEAPGCQRPWPGCLFRGTTRDSVTRDDSVTAWSWSRSKLGPVPIWDDRRIIAALLCMFLCVYSISVCVCRKVKYESVISLNVIFQTNTQYSRYTQSTVYTPQHSIHSVHNAHTIYVHKVQYVHMVMSTKARYTVQ